MRYLLIAMVIVISGFFLRPAHAGIFSECLATVRNCLPDTDGNALAWCAYNGSSTWDTMYSASSGSLDSGDSTSDVYCASDSSCYFIGLWDDGIYVCTSFDVSGTVDCNEFACVGYDSTDAITWSTGDSEYCCLTNECFTDCSD